MAEQQMQRCPQSLMHEHPDSDVDGPDQRGARREGGPGTRVGRQEHDDPSDGSHRDHDSPPRAEYEPHEQQGRDHRFSLRCKTGHRGGSRLCRRLGAACHTVASPRHGHHDCRWPREE